MFQRSEQIPGGTESIVYNQWQVVFLGNCRNGFEI